MMKHSTPQCGNLFSEFRRQSETLVALAPVLVAIDALYLNIRALHFTIQEWKHVAVTRVVQCIYSTCVYTC